MRANFINFRAHNAGLMGESDTPVVGVCDHAVPVEHSGDVLLQPVARRQLLPQQAAHSVLDLLGVPVVVPSGDQCQDGPGCVHHLGLLPLQL